MQMKLDKTQEGGEPGLVKFVKKDSKDSIFEITTNKTTEVKFY